MNETEIKQFVSSNLPKWSVKQGKLLREIRTKNWTESMSIANMISYLSEQSNHHPDLSIKYSNVIIELFTHSSNSITEKDLFLAQKIDEILIIN